jgi:preprotein translocase subunit YajC
VEDQVPTNKPLRISEEAAVQMPMKTVASLIIMVAVGTWAYFGIIEKQNKMATQLELMSKDVENNSEFRIKWPRGQMGTLPADSEQYMMIEDLYKTTDRLNEHIESMALNKVNIEFLTKQMEKVLIDIEKLKDQNRDFKYNGNGGTH